MKSIQNKIVFITGASSGIGASCAKYFAEGGAKLILCARRIEVLETFAEELRNSCKAEILCMQLDVRNHGEIQGKIAALPSQWKNIDILINNAGMASGLDHIQDANVKDWDLMIDTNIKGLLYVTREILPQMVARDSGHIINIGSIAGHSTYPKGVVYCATKFAVNALSQGLRQDLFGAKVRVSTVDPGAVETNFSTVRFKGDAERAKSIYAGYDPLTPDDIADAVLYCASRPLHVNVSEIIVMPTAQVAVTSIYRGS